MKDVVLIELANRWEADSIQPDTEKGAEEAKIGNAIAKGRRVAKQECATTLKRLVSILGEKDSQTGTYLISHSA